MERAETKPRQLLVIGGGIGGYTAAIRGARLGMRVCLVEQGALGGTCLNVGCIPTKSLLHHSAQLRDMAQLGGHGVDPAAIRPRMALLAQEKSAAVKRLVGGVETMIRRNQVERVKDRASFVGHKTVRLAGSGETLSADIVVVATGSIPSIPRIEGIGLPGVITSDEAVALEQLPESIAILGGGVIGVEFAQIFANLGVAVTIFEMADAILGGEDREAVDVLAGVLSSQGVVIRTGARVRSISRRGEGLCVAAEDKNGSCVVDAGLVLVATGRRPNIGELGLENACVEIRDGAIAVDEWQRTSAEGVYAVGDVCGGPLLAHKAGAEAESAMANATGRWSAPVRSLAMPSAVYTQPELASVGLSEAQARQRGQVKVGRFPFAANGKAIAGGHFEGFVKIVADAEYEQILGITIVGPEASNLLGEATLAVQMEMTLPALMGTIHAHPTLCEALVEAAHDAHDGGAIHLPPHRGAA